MRASASSGAIAVEASQRAGGNDRSALRAHVLASAPRWYSPHLHLALTSVLGLAPMCLGIALLDELRVHDLAFAAALFVLCCLTEWWAHRHVLHVRRPLLGRLFDEHTPEHHHVFWTDDMMIAGLSEARLVLIPSSGVAAILVAISPLPITLWLVGYPNGAALTLAIGAGYVAAYEWIHLAAHLPPNNWVLRCAPVRFLRRHHALHHHPSRMQRCNFNVACPLADLVCGTLVTRIGDR